MRVQIQTYQNDIDVLKTEILELKCSQEFICGQYENLIKDYNDLIKANNE